MRSIGEGRSLSSSRQVPPASGGPGQATLIPMPATTAGEGGGEFGLGQDPGQLGRPHQQVVGPFERCLDPGHLGAGIQSGEAQGAGAQVQVVGVAVGAEEHRGQQVGARRRLPAPIEASAARRLVIGHRHQPRRIPLAGAARAGSELVESISSNRRTCHSPAHMAQTIRRVQL